MHKFIFVAAPFAALLWGNVAYAASDLFITAKVIPSSTCSISIDGGGMFDAGEIPLSSLADEGMDTGLQGGSLSFSIQCRNPILVGLKTIDNQLGSAVDGGFGIGYDHSGNKLGRYNLTMHTGIVNGSSGSFVESTDNGETWLTPSTSLRLSPDSNHVSSFASSAGSAPIPVDSVTARLDAAIYITDKAGLDLDGTDAIPIAGSATLEMRYI